MWQHRSSRFGGAAQTGQFGPAETEQEPGRAGHLVRSGRASLEGVVSEYPLSVLVGGFALGAAVGVALGFMLSKPVEPRWHERIPDALGRRWIEAFIETLPEAVKQKIR